MLVSQLPNSAYITALTNSNPYEKVGKSIFTDSAGVKLACMDSACNIINPSGIFYFADICGGTGGLADYILWKNKSSSGWGITPKSSNNFKKDRFSTFYGSDNSGDIFNIKNIQEFTQVIMKNTDLKGVHLVTAYGGISVASDPLHQELHNKQVLLCEALIMFKVLRVGGNYVFKSFDLLLPFSAGLLFILYHSFDKITITKPLTSRAADSERFIVCIGLKDNLPEEFIDNLTKACSRFNELKKEMREIRKIENKNFLTFSDRKRLKIIDINGIVDQELIFKDEEFVDYLQYANMKLSIKQTEGLKDILDFHSGNYKKEYNCEEIKRKCLEEWKLPMIS